ncbi:MAG: hypothetical protein R2798_14870 [Chitinophagales bacterium]|nr:hypothetical protein [Bacteroidota bacterium]
MEKAVSANPNNFSGSDSFRKNQNTIPKTAILANIAGNAEAKSLITSSL